MILYRGLIHIGLWERNLWLSQHYQRTSDMFITGYVGLGCITKNKRWALTCSLDTVHCYLLSLSRPGCWLTGEQYMLKVAVKGGVVKQREPMSHKWKLLINDSSGSLPLFRTMLQYYKGIIYLFPYLVKYILICLYTLEFLHCFKENVFKHSVLGKIYCLILLHLHEEKAKFKE